jgi:hypothetical protein
MVDFDLTWLNFKLFEVEFLFDVWSYHKWLKILINDIKTVNFIRLKKVLKKLMRELELKNLVSYS